MHIAIKARALDLRSGQAEFQHIEIRDLISFELRLIRAQNLRHTCGARELTDPFEILSRGTENIDCEPERPRVFGPDFKGNFRQLGHLPTTRTTRRKTSIGSVNSNT